MKSNEEKLTDILSHLDRISYVKTEKIPNIDLYMDQVTTFMETHLKRNKRNPDDKVLTKTMINNYAKNQLLPSPVKKKYSQEHILILLFIYYYKNLISINDIKQLLDPLTKYHFTPDSELPLTDIYEEIFSLETAQMDRLKEDVKLKFDNAMQTFTSAPEDNRYYLQLFSFISELAFDVYLKKQIIEMLIDQLREEQAPSAEQRKKK